MTTSRRRGADQIQRALNRWIAQAKRENALLTPAERLAHLAGVRAHNPRGNVPHTYGHARHGTEGSLDGGDRCVRRASGQGRGKSRRSMALIEAASSILSEIQPASIRAVCYRLFTMGLITAMTKGETNRVSTQLTYAREEGLIPWGWIVDETREPERVNAWEDPAAYVETVKRAYRRDRWADQAEWIEVWSEKGTVRGTLAPVLHEYGVTFRVMHGYGSATAIHQAARETGGEQKVLTILYVGDWDPSGLHMSEVDLPRRLLRYGGNVDLVRLALTERDTRSGLPSFQAEEAPRSPLPVVCQPSRLSLLGARRVESCHPS